MYGLNRKTKTACREVRQAVYILLFPDKEVANSRFRKVKAPPPICPENYIHFFFPFLLCKYKI